MTSYHHLPWAATLAVVSALMAGCGRDQPGAPGTGGSSDGLIITGRERIGWDQRADTDSDLADLAFFMFVDDQRRQLTEVACGALSGQVASCSARLPAMSPGVHSLSMTSMNGAGVESERSPSLAVILAGLTTSAGPFAQTVAQDTPSPMSESGRAVHVVAEGLRQPVDLAVTPDGRVLVAEREGTVRMVRGGVLASRPALVLDDASVEMGGLLAVALDPAFARSGWVYLVYTTADGYRVARYREVGGALGERVVLLDGVEVPEGGAATLRFGPDAKLHVALGSADDVIAGDWGSYNGKILRLNVDGTAPADQVGSTPVFLADAASVLAMDWAAETGALWLAGGRVVGDGFLVAVPPAPAGSRPRRSTTRYALPDGRLPSALLTYRGAIFKDWEGDLLMALPDAASVLRLRPDAGDSARLASTELVVGERAGRVRALGLGAAGTLYLANDHQLLTLSPGVAPSPGP
jgi:aldose sugar dehydrogenase